MNNPYVSKEETLQYCLNQGTGVEYDRTPHNSTTEKEIQTACEENRNVRYINEATVNILYRWHRPEQIAYAIKTNMDLCDFDDWQTLQDLFGVAMPYSVEKKIEAIMMNDVPDLRPIEIEIDPEFRNNIENNYAESMELSICEAIEYALYTKMDHNIATKIWRAFSNELCIDIRDLIVERIKALLKERKTNN